MKDHVLDELPLPGSLRGLGGLNGFYL
jgi:hypothetical protein